MRPGAHPLARLAAVRCARQRRGRGRAAADAAVGWGVATTRNDRYRQLEPRVWSEMAAVGGSAVRPGRQQTGLLPPRSPLPGDAADASPFFSCHLARSFPSAVFDHSRTLAAPAHAQGGRMEKRRGGVGAKAASGLGERFVDLRRIQGPTPLPPRRAWGDRLSALGLFLLSAVPVRTRAGHRGSKYVCPSPRPAVGPETRRRAPPSAAAGPAPFPRRGQWPARARRPAPRPREQKDLFSTRRNRRRPPPSFRSLPAGPARRARPRRSRRLPICPGCPSSKRKTQGGSRRSVVGLRRNRSSGVRRAGRRRHRRGRREAARNVARMASSSVRERGEAGRRGCGVGISLSKGATNSGESGTDRCGVAASGDSRRELPLCRASKRTNPTRPLPAGRQASHPPLGAHARRREARCKQTSTVARRSRSAEKARERAPGPVPLALLLAPPPRPFSLPRAAPTAPPARLPSRYSARLGARARAQALGARGLRRGPPGASGALRGPFGIRRRLRRLAGSGRGSPGAFTVASGAPAPPSARPASAASHAARPLPGLPSSGASRRAVTAR